MSARKISARREELCAVLLGYMRTGKRIKNAYKMQDLKFERARALGLRLNQPVKLPNGDTVVLRDEFEKGHTVFRAKKFSRFVLEQVKPKKPAAKAKKKGGKL